MSDTNFEATVMIPTDQVKRIERDFDWPDWLPFYPTTAFFETDDPFQWKMSIYMAEQPTFGDIDIMGKALRAFTGAEIKNPVFSRLKTQDWVSQSQKLHKPIVAGRFVAFGEHDKDNVDPTKVPLQIEGRQAFGTGSHETTKGCLLALDSLADELVESKAPKRILDLGTGSGILAMAMAGVWNVPILASDNDAVAIEAARDIMGINGITFSDDGAGVTIGVTTAVAEGFDDPIFAKEGPFDLITANILALPLIDMSADIVANMAEGGLLILAGLLEKQEMAVTQVFETNGLTLVSRDQINEWPVLVMQKS
jgi:ribosomal protein L11 methyltransferase